MVAAIRGAVLTMIKTTAVLVLAFAVIATSAGAATPSGEPTPAPPAAAPPTAAPAAQSTIAPTAPTATPPTAGPSASSSASASGAAAVASPAVSPPANLVQFTGQLLDVRGQYVYFTTGDAFPTVDALRVVDYFTGAPTTVAPAAKMFARVTIDPVSKNVTEIAITKRRLQSSEGLGPASAFVVVGSKPVPAPEIAGQPVTGKQVAVLFEVTVPPTTAFTDQIFISTDASEWNPTAIKLDRVDAYKYRAQRFFASGTKFAYRVTRGSWNSVERGEDNLDSAPHQFFVREVDSLVARVVVFHWSDEHGVQQGAGPDSLPTPYNPSPFGGRIVVPQIPVRPTNPPGR
jgi:hypothetical protein